MSKKIAMNARFYSHREPGMQRYGMEMASRLGDELDVLRPRRPLHGPEGDFWEQAYLAGASRGRLLWSPNNTGPLAVSHQVCTIHDIISLDRPEWFSGNFSRWYEWLLPRLARRVQHIIAISEFTKQRLIERLRVSPDRITVIHNGVDPCFSPRPESEVELARHALGIPTPHYLLCLGSAEPQKNVARLLVAWQRISRRFRGDVHLVVAGVRGTSRVFDEIAVARIPARVHFTGYVRQEDLPALYSGALALIYPSLYEGFGLPLVEAMACGTPVVTSATTSMPEIAGNAAILVDPESSDDIAEGMRLVVECREVRDTLRYLGLEQARKFCWDTAATMTRSLLHQLV